VGVFFFVKEKGMWPTEAQIHSSVTRYKRDGKRKIDLGDIILVFFTGWLIGILTAIWLFQKV